MDKNQILNNVAKKVIEYKIISLYVVYIYIMLYAWSVMTQS